MVSKRTKLMSGLVAVVMLISMLTAFVLPVSADPVTGGIVAEKGLYDATALPNIKGGIQTDKYEYQVNDYAGMLKMAEIVNGGTNNFSSITVYQTADIDMGWAQFSGIGWGDGKAPFKGTFDGNGFTIDNLYIARTGGKVAFNTSVALFGLADGATIKNVGISSGLIIGYKWVGAFLGRGIKCKLYNCWNAATVVTGNSNQGAGGLAGTNINGSAVVNCYNVGAVISVGSKAAGLVGWANCPADYIQNCYNAGQIVNGSGPANEEMHQYAEILSGDFITTDGDGGVGTNTRNNYYIKGRSSKVSSVADYLAAGNTIIPNTEKTLAGTDGATGVEASALTDGTLATGLNSNPITDTAIVGNYKVTFENVAGVGYPVLTYRNAGNEIVAQRYAKDNTNVNGDKTLENASPLFAQMVANNGNFGQNTSALWFTNGFNIGDPDDLFLLAALTLSARVTILGDSQNITLTADIDMAQRGAWPDIYEYIPFGTNYTAYDGTFDGGSHAIYNWGYHARREGTGHAMGGLISQIGGSAVIKNLGMIDAYGKYSVGSSAPLKDSDYYIYPALMVERGDGGSGSITNCFATGTMEFVDVNNVNNDGSVFSTTWAATPTISNCWGDVKVTGAMAANTTARVIGKVPSTDAKANMSTNIINSSAVASNVQAGNYSLECEQRIGLAAGTKEHAWYLNSLSGWDQIFTVKNGETTFGDSTNRTGRITLTCGDAVPVYMYGNAGEVVNLTYPAAVLSYAITEGEGSVDGTALTMGSTDVTVEVTLQGANYADLEAAYNNRLGTNASYYVNGNGESMATVMADAKAMLEGARDDEQEAVDAITARFAGIKYASYPNVPLASEYASYTDAPGYRVNSTAEFNAVYTNKGKFTEDQVLYIENDIALEGNAATSMSGLKASIEGVIKNDKKPVISGINFTGTNTNTESWLGTTYPGKFIKNLTFNNCNATNLGWQGSLLAGKITKTTTFENLTFNQCKVVTGNSNGLGLLVGILQTAGASATFTDITVENCEFDRRYNGTDKAGNCGLVLGRLEKGSVTMDGIVVRNNTIYGTGSLNTNGVGILAGEVTDNAVIKNVLVCNTTTQGNGGFGGVIGVIKNGDGTSNNVAVTIDNVMAFNNGRVEQFAKEGSSSGTGTLTVTITNVYTDTLHTMLGYSKVATSDIGAKNEQDFFTSGTAAWTLNNADDVEQLWKMEGEAPAFADASTATYRVTLRKQNPDLTTYRDEFLYFNAGAAVELLTDSAFEFDMDTLPAFATYENDTLSFTMPAADVSVSYDLVGVDFTGVEELVEKYAEYEGKFNYYVDGADMQAAYEAAKAAVDLKGTEADMNTVYAAINAANAAEANVDENYDVLADTFTSDTEYNAPSGKDYLFFKSYNPTNWIVADSDDWRGIVELSRTTTFSGVTIHIVKDINMGGVHVDPVQSQFAGTLNGHNHVFENLLISVDPAKDANKRFVGLIGLATDTTTATIANLGIASGLIEATSANGNLENQVGAFIGEAANDRFYNCWNAATIKSAAGQASVSGIARILDNSVIVNCYNLGNIINTGTNRASGIAEWVRYRNTIQNSFSTGTVTGPATQAIALRNDAGDNNVINNVYVIGTRMALNDGNNGNTAYNNKGFELAAGAEASGELAAKMNAGYTAGNDAYGKVYFTVEGGKTVFGTEVNQTRTVTFTEESAEDRIAYYNSGTPIALNYADNVESYQITAGNAELVNNEGVWTLKLTGEDVTVKVTLAGANKTELQARYDKYVVAKGDYFETADGELVSVLLADAKDVLDDKAATQTTVDALVAEFDALVYRAYPNVPLASEFAAYPGAPGYRITNEAEFLAAEDHEAAYTLDQVLYLEADLDLTGVTAEQFNGFTNTKVSFEGNKHTISNLNAGDGEIHALFGDRYYYGSFVKNLTLENVTTKGGYARAALVSDYAGAGLTISNVHLKNCTVINTTTYGRNAMGGLLGRLNATAANGVTIENCTIIGTKLVSNGVTRTGNTGFIVGQMNKSTTFNINNVLVKDCELANRGDFGLGFAVGALEDNAKATITNVALLNNKKTDILTEPVVDTAIQATELAVQASAYSDFIGVAKSCTLNASNILVFGNSQPESSKITGTWAMTTSDGANMTLSNIHTDRAELIKGAATPDGCTAAQTTAGYAVYSVNAASGDAAYKYEIADGAIVRDTDGEGLPLAIEIQLADAATLEVGAGDTLYTDVNGLVIGGADMFENAVWPYDVATKVFTEETTVTGYTVPEHECDWEYTKDEGTHTAVCTKSWTPVDGIVVECDAVIAETTCTYTNYVKNDATTREEAAHIGTCVCGNTNTILCAADTGWTTSHTDPDCLNAGTNTYSCSICGHNFVEDAEPALGHAWGNWKPDDAGETHSRTCTREGCNVTESDDCEYGEWSTTVEPGYEPGEQIRTCVCGRTDVGVIPALPSLALDNSKYVIIGTDVVANVNINNITAFATGTFNVTYDADGLNLTGAAADGAEIVVGTPSEPDAEGMVTVAITYTAAADITADGTVLALTFHAKDTAEYAEYSIAVAAAGVKNTAGDDVAILGNSSTVNVIEAATAKGDVNGDDKTSIADAVLLLRYVVGDPELNANNLNLTAADVNNDGEVLADDIVLILKSLVGTATL